MSLLRTRNQFIRSEASESGRWLSTGWRWEMRVSSLAVDSPGEHPDLRSTRDLSHVQRRNWHCRMEYRSRHDKVLLISTRVSVPQSRAVSS